MTTRGLDIERVTISLPRSLLQYADLRAAELGTSRSQISGLPERSAVNCAQLATIQQQGAGSRLRPPRGQRELRPIGRLSATTMAQVDAALKYNLGLT